MANNTSLATNHHVFAHLGATADTRLGGNNGTLADLYIMGNLYQVVQLYPLADDGGTHGCTVDSSIGTNFHLVFNDHIT